jgi:hypothetical protein
MLIHKKVQVVLLTLTLMQASSAVLAHWCTDTYKDLYVYNNGSVNIWPNWRNHYVQVCNINVAWKGIPVKTCEAWLKILQSAVLYQKTMTFMYAENSPTCAAMPVYAGAWAPLYIMLKDY